MAGRLEEGKKKKKKEKKKTSIFTSTGGVDSKDLGSKFRAIDPTNLSTRI